MTPHQSVILPEPFHFWLIADGTVERDQNTLTIHDKTVIHHWGRVKRLKSGEPGAVVLPQGAFQAVIQSCHSEALTLSLGDPLPLPVPSPDVTLMAALLKPEAWETLLQKTTELGVSRIQPVITDHTVAHWPDAESKLIRWQKIIHLAAEQSEQRQLPQLLPPLSLQNALQSLDPKHGTPPAFIALEHARAVSLIKASCERPSKQFTILIGPEGGWSHREVELTLAQGVQPVTLGPGLLKADTAAMLAVGILKQIQPFLESTNPS